jgi:hypothetical protein
MMNNLISRNASYGNVAKTQKEAYSFMINTIIIKIVLVKFKKDDLLEFYYVQRIQGQIKQSFIQIV